MGALEASIDKDWARFKASAFFASGDDDIDDGKAKGFDTIYDFTNFAGGPFSFWNRSGIPLTQTAVFLKAPGSLLPSLRSNKFEGQANFVNPGLLLLNAAVDLELTPKLKAVLNANYLRFHKTGALESLLFQPGIRKTIGIDLGAGVLYRPLLNENVVIQAGLTALLPGAGFDDLFSSPCSQPALRRRQQDPVQRLPRPEADLLRRNRVVAHQTCADADGGAGAGRARPRRGQRRAGPGPVLRVAAAGRREEPRLPLLPHRDGQPQHARHRRTSSSPAWTATAANGDGAGQARRPTCAPKDDRASGGRRPTPSAATPRCSTRTSPSSAS